MNIKPVFQKKQWKPWNFFKSLILYWIYLKKNLEVFQRPISNRLSNGKIVHSWKKEENPETFQKSFPQIRISSKLLLTSFTFLN